ncbi:MAG: hypothetical protein KDJ80_08965 [Nitratireductor sp.]|nr:hypothetical protein [Nitratireductor sp.]
MAFRLESQRGSVVEETLRQLLDLPHRLSREPKVATDLALDVTVPEYNFGDALVFDAGVFVFPLAWRPSITVTGRLYKIDSGETIEAVTVKHTLNWLRWVGKILSVPRLLRIRASTSNADMARLTTEAVVKLLSKILKK